MSRTALSMLKDGFAQTVRRFPVSTLCSALLTWLSWWLIWADARDLEYLHIEGAISILIIGCFLFITLQLLYENNPNLSRRYYAAVSLAYLALGALLHFDRDITFFARNFLCLGAFLLMFVAPYLKLSGNHNESVWAFAYRVALRIAFTLLAAIVLYLGTIALVASADFLFDLKVDYKVYVYIWVFVACFFSPLFAMAGIPKVYADSEESYPKFLRILICNLVIPLWFCYALIVYAYIIKIIFTGQLPHGGVAILVSIFAAKGMCIYLSSYPLYQRRQTIAYWFGRHWMKLLAAPLVLLAIAIAKRIHAHGVTPDRYAIVLCLAWLLIAMAERLRSEAAAPRRIILWAVLLLFVTSVGPWGIDNVSTNSQIAKLEQVLEKNHMFSDGRLTAPMIPVSFADRLTISSVIDYLVETRKTDRIKPWFDAKYQSDIDSTPHTVSGTYKNLQQVIAEDMGIEYVWHWQKDKDGQPQKTFTYNEEWHKNALAISGYDYWAETSNYTQMCSADGSQITLERDGNLPPLVFKVNFDPLTAHLTLVNNATHKSLSFDLSKLLKKSEWYKRKTADKLELEAENSEMKARMIVKNVYGTFDGEKPVISSLGTVLLIRLK